MKYYSSKVNLIMKQKTKELRFEWTVAASRFVEDKEVLEKLVPPSSVQILTIVGYTSLSIPDWLMDIRQYLPDLLELNLLNFPKCYTLPALGQLPIFWLGCCRLLSKQPPNFELVYFMEHRTSFSSDRYNCVGRSVIGEIV